jgi:flagellar basal-body rod protein FlgB
MLNKIDTEIAFVQNALNLRARRHEILAGNIANSDTPNYKARDIDFVSALKSAMGAQGGPLKLARTNGAHLDGAGSATAGGHLMYRSSVQPSLDGNTVDLNLERAQFTENALHYQFLLDRAASTFKRMGQALGSTQQ